MGNDKGAAYVFTFSGTTWSQQAKLTASDGVANDHFGNSLALFGDAALVGMSSDDIGSAMAPPLGRHQCTCSEGSTVSQRPKLQIYYLP